MAGRRTRTTDSDQAEHHGRNKRGQEGTQQEPQRRDGPIEEPAQDGLPRWIRGVPDDGQAAADHGTTYHRHLEAITKIRHERRQVRDQCVVVDGGMTITG